MSDYDKCVTCGADGGIQYGYCEICTPAEVFEKSRKFSQMETEARNQIKDKYAAEQAEIDRMQFELNHKINNEVEDAVHEYYVDFKEAYARGAASALRQNPC